MKKSKSSLTLQSKHPGDRDYEREIEQYLKREVEKAGGVCRKFASPGHRGVPDRLCIFPGGRIYFVEVKRWKGTLSPLQKHEIGILLSLGCRALVVRTTEMVDRLIQLATSHI